MNSPILDSSDLHLVYRKPTNLIISSFPSSSKKTLLAFNILVRRNEFVDRDHLDPIDDATFRPTVIDVVVVYANIDINSSWAEIAVGPERDEVGKVLFLKIERVFVRAVSRFQYLVITSLEGSAHSKVINLKKKFL